MKTDKQEFMEFFENTGEISAPKEVIEHFQEAINKLTNEEIEKALKEKSVE